MITHIVFFKLKERSDENLRKAVGILEALQGRVPSLKTLEVGVDVVRSSRSYDIALTARFDSLEGLESYRSHPEHVKAATYLRGVSEAIAAVDYESE
ncbi:MAG: Dabb family protein [Thermodesulfobacteriota bacterium]|nr:MAG: Dabb family protein [Thermodesulfobacteriota bacterium]